MRIPQRGERGFTLIELLIVIAIIGVLAAIAVPVFLNQDDSANTAAAEAEASALETLIAAGISLNGTVTTITDDTTITVPNVGSMTVTDGTMTVSGADGTDYCASVTVGTSTSSYGPGCVSGGTLLTPPDISGWDGAATVITNGGAVNQLINSSYDATACGGSGGFATTSDLWQTTFTAGSVWTITVTDGTSTSLPYTGSVGDQEYPSPGNPSCVATPVSNINVDSGFDQADWDSKFGTGFLTVDSVLVDTAAGTLLFTVTV